MYVYEYAALTHPGRMLENNEDNFYIDGAYREDITEECYKASGRVDNGYLVAAVCDGMGGYACGEKASLAAVETMAQWCGAFSKKDHIFRMDAMSYIDEANHRVCELRKSEDRPVGSTVAVLELCDTFVTVVNLGDSRVYRLREGHLEQLSTDHSVVARMTAMGLITHEEAKKHPMRHQITQHLGIRSEEMLLEPAVSEGLTAMEGDWYLLCSDGLTDMVEDEDIEDGLQNNNSVEDTVRQLVQKAVDAGGRDNITVIAIQVQKQKGFWNRLKGKFK